MVRTPRTVRACCRVGHLSSPGHAALGSRFELPLTRDRLVQPRSTTNHVAPWGRSRHDFLGLTFGSANTIVDSGLRPIVTSVLAERDAVAGGQQEGSGVPSHPCARGSGGGDLKRSGPNGRALGQLDLHRTDEHVRVVSRMLLGRPRRAPAASDWCTSANWVVTWGAELNSEMVRHDRAATDVHRIGRRPSRGPAAARALPAGCRS